MCLDKILEEKPQKKIDEGYKVFTRRPDGVLVGEHFGEDKPIPLEKWINESDYRERDWWGELFYPKTISMIGGTEYRTGFHVYVDYPSWKQLWSTDIVCRVSVKGIVAYGYEFGGHLTIVCKKIYVHRDDLRLEAKV